MSGSESKTEKATRRKREDARKEGQVSVSEDTTQVVVTGILMGYLVADGERLGQWLITLMLLPLDYIHLPFAAANSALGPALAATALPWVIGFVIGAVLLASLIIIIQIGPLFSPKALQPSLKKLNVVQNVKNIFSAKTLVDMLKMIIKAFLVTLIVILVLWGHQKLLVIAPWGGTKGIGHALAKTITDMLIMLIVSFGVIAIADIFWQRHSHEKKLMMSKSEVKRGYKEDEGDPMVKDQRRSLFRELIYGDDHVSQASAIVANPTHLAIALFYQPSLTPLPVILAKDEDGGAQRIFAIARQAGVPILQNIPLARELYNYNVLTFIPSHLIEPVAEVIVAAQHIRRAADGYAYNEQTDDEIPDNGL